MGPPKYFTTFACKMHFVALITLLVPAMTIIASGVHRVRQPAPEGFDKAALEFQSVEQFFDPDQDQTVSGLVACQGYGDYLKQIGDPRGGSDWIVNYGVCQKITSPRDASVMHLKCAPRSGKGEAYISVTCERSCVDLYRRDPDTDLDQVHQEPYCQRADDEQPQT